VLGPPLGQIQFSGPGAFFPTIPICDLAAVPGSPASSTCTLGFDIGGGALVTGTYGPSTTSFLTSFGTFVAPPL
jgi:hypothetical protein